MIYEMRTYTDPPGGIPEVLKAWAEAIPHREECSPLEARWYTELGGLNRFTQKATSVSPKVSTGGYEQ